MSDSVIKNEYGETVFILQPDMTRPAGVTASSATPQQVADAYLRANLPDLGLAQSMLADESVPAGATVVPVVEFTAEKDVAGNKVVVYRQTVIGLEVFGARLGMQVDASAFAVESVQSSMHGQISLQNADAAGVGKIPREPSPAQLKKLIGIDLAGLGKGRIERQVVYRYEPDQREERHDHEGCVGGAKPQIPPLPPTTIAGLAKGQHYVVDEVLFQAAMAEGQAPVNWRALVEPRSGDILYLRALVSCATGLVFDRDPQTQAGAAVSAASSNAVLNPFRTSHTLAGLTAATPQQLTGEFVVVQDTQAPTQAPPLVPNPASNFGFEVRDEHFSAVCAYHNCDRLFRTMQDFGFNVASYFDGTTFPVPVDHRALGDDVNAQAPGNVNGNGLLELRFGKMIPGEPVGIATDNRVAWHEFGHGLLWDHVGSPNFGFAHSAGDALAAILNDPESQAADRGDTFPWTHAGAPGLDRRHDRTPAGGWAWFGPNWNTQYGGEQVLSSTMYRFYLSIGGGSTDLATRRRASNTAAFLIFKAIGALVSTTPFPEIYAGQLQSADRTTPSFQGIAGGALHKVVRWSFEKQGLFQPGAAPGQPTTVMTEGNPPDVDVYIDDGRNGEYAYQANHWSCQDMWVRQAADGGLTHQDPVVNQANYMYVRVKNRGTQTAQEVRVDAYHCLPGTGLAFPDDWQPMATATLPAPGPLASGGETIVGPFEFVPTQVGHECLLAIAHADGDPGNDTTITGTIPEHRLVPFDNNIGQRNVSPVYPSLKSILARFRKHPIWIRNPFRETVVVQIEVELPQFLQHLGWQMQVETPGGSKFELGPRDRREVALLIKPGRDFDVELAKRAVAKGDRMIGLRTYLNGELSGGMSYALGFGAGEEDDRPRGEPDRPTRQPGDPVVLNRPTIEEILRILQDRGIGAGDRPVRTLRIEFDFGDDAEA